MFLVSALKEIKAQDAIEWMLAMQIVTAHAATMRAARRLTFSETFVETEYTEKVYNKLSRTVAHLVPELRNLWEF